MTDYDIPGRIVHVLKHYPVISPSMLQTGLGNIKPKDWRPVLEDLIRQGTVHRDMQVDLSPSGQDRHYIKIYLNGVRFEPPN